jgi:hypothetical protein
MSITKYDRDYFEWSQEQSRLLKERKFDLLDVENLAEEIESLGKSDRHKLESLLFRLLEHLLKRRYVGIQECYRGWDIEIRNFSREIKKLLKDSPSFNNYIREIAPKCYQDAIRSVSQDYELYDFSGGLDIEAVIEELS